MLIGAGAAIAAYSGALRDWPTMGTVVPACLISAMYLAIGANLERWEPFRRRILGGGSRPIAPERFPRLRRQYFVISVVIVVFFIGIRLFPEVFVSFVSKRHLP